MYYKNNKCAVTAAKGELCQMRALYFVLIIIVLIPLSIGCLDETAVDVTPRVAALEAWKANMEPQISNGNQAWVWKTGTFDPWQTSIFTPWKATVDAKMGTAGAPSVDLSQYVPVSTYNAKMALLDAAIKVLQDNSGTGGGTGGGGSDTGTVVFTNNPVSIPQIFSSSTGGNSNPWIMTIKNNSNTWQYVKPMIQLNVASGQPSSIVSDVSVMGSGGNCSLTGTYLVPGNFTFSPSTMGTVATPSIIAFPVSGCNGSGEWYIGPGQSQAYNMQIQGLKTANPILWNVTCSISSRSM